MADQLEAMVERDADAVCESLVAEIARATQWPQLLGAHRALVNVRKLAFIMVNGSLGGTRLTKGKCCGRWETFHEWSVTASDLREAANELIEYAERSPKGEIDG